MIAQRIRVLQILPQWGPGGAERLALDLARSFDPQRTESAIVSLYPFADTQFERIAAKSGVSLYYLRKTIGLHIPTFRALHRVLAEFRPDVVHTHLYSLPYALPACLVNAIPGRVHTIHSIASKEAEGGRRILWSWAFHRLGVLPVSISQQVWETMQGVFGSLISPIIYNGVDWRRFELGESEGIEWRRRHQLNREQYVFVVVARMFAEKNHALLLASFQDVLRSFPQARLLIVGDGPLRAVLERQVNSYGVQEEVKFLGIREDIPDILNAADAMVLSSDWEGLPVSVLEAMAAGKPVIGTAVGGVPELIRNGETGMLVPGGDGDRLTGAMATICSDPNRSRRMGLEGRKVVIERFDIRETARQYEDLYRELLRARARECSRVKNLVH